MHWTGQSGGMVFLTIPVTPDDGEKAQEEEESILEQNEQVPHIIFTAYS